MEGCSDRRSPLTFSWRAYVCRPSQCLRRVATSKSLDSTNLSASSNLPYSEILLFCRARHAFRVCDIKFSIYTTGVRNRLIGILFRSSSID